MRRNSFERPAGERRLRLDPTIRRARGGPIGPALVLAALAALSVLIVRVWLLSRYSSSVPFWDAWGAEAAPLYTPWMEGTFQWKNLWAWHNEHRIFFTRLIDLVLFVANDSQWDVRVQTLAGSTMFAVMTGMSIFWLRRHLASPLSFLLSACVLLATLLPNGWANTYHGFQSCFYFVLLFAVLAMRNAAQARFTWIGGVLVAGFALAAVFSLAAGVLVAMAALIIVVGRAWLERVGPIRAIPLVLPLLAVAVWALIDARKGDIHPATFGELARAFAIMLSWPFSSFAGIALWLPAVLVLAHIIWSRCARTADLLFGGFSIWVILICAAAAWARASYFVDVQSRYTDLLIPSFVAQVYFAFRCAGLIRTANVPRVLPNVLASTFALISAAGLTYVSRGEFLKWREYDFMTRIGTTNVRAYLDGDTSALDGHPYGYIPYPEAKPLAAVLDSPVVRTYLPVSLTSLLRPVDQLTRSCHVRLGGSNSIPRQFEVGCAHVARPSANELSMGRLSRITYAIWERIGRQAYSSFTMDSSSARDLPSARCALDQINGSPVTKTEVDIAYVDVVRLIGWVGPQPVNIKTPVMRVILDQGDGQRYSGHAVTGTARPGVAEFVAEQGYELPGFNTVLDGSVVPPGRYRVFLGNSVGDNCDSGISINIKNVADTRLSY